MIDFLIYLSSSICNYHLQQVPSQRDLGYFMEGIAECKSFNYSTGEILCENATPRYNPTEFENK